MRGRDGNSSWWTGSGNEDSTQSISTMKKLEAGAYVVNSNIWTGDCNDYYQMDYNREFTRHPSSNHYRSKRLSITDAWQRPSADSRDSTSHYRYSINHGNTSNTQSILPERHPSNFVNSASYQTRKSYPGFSVQSSNIEAYQNSVPAQEFGSERSIQGPSSSNVYLGTMVRVKIPELHPEVWKHDADMKENGANIVYGQEVSKVKFFQQEVGNPGNHKVCDGPVPVETYKRINNWLRNCQQFTDDSLKPQTTKSVLDSQKLNHSTIERNNQQQMVSVSKPNYGVSIQSGAVSNSRFVEEPRIVAGLESKNTKTKVPANSSSHHQRSINLVWTEHNGLAYQHERHVSRNAEIVSSPISNIGYTPQRNRTYFECDLSPTSSEWSSETLSLSGSDGGSYCTDFTPFELGENVMRTQGQKCQKYASEFEQECAPIKRNNLFVSQISVEAKPYAKTSAKGKELSPNSKGQQLENTYLSRKSNAKLHNYTRHDNSDSKYRQRELKSKTTDDETRKLRVTQISLPVSNPQSSVADIFGENRSLHLDNFDHDDSTSFITEIEESQTRHKRHQRMMNPQTTGKFDRNLKNLEESGRNDVKAEISANGLKLSKGRRSRTAGSDVGCPQHLTLSADKDQPLSLAQGKILCRQDDGVKGTLNFRPVTQVKNGSLSITIRPKHRMTYEDADDLDNAEDLLYKRDEFSRREIEKQLSEVAKMQGIIDKPSETVRAFKNVEIIATNNDSVSEYSNASSQEAEKLDKLARTSLHIDVPAKVIPSASKTESPLKLPTKADKSSVLTNSPIEIKQIVSEEQRNQFVSDFDESIICRHTEQYELQEYELQQSSRANENQVPESYSGIVLSSDNSPKAHNAKKISAFKRIFKKAKSYVGEKLGENSIDHENRRKNNSVSSLEGENKTSSQNRVPELIASLATSRSKSRCKHLESIDEAEMFLPDNSAGMQTAPNASSYYANEVVVEDVSQTTGYETTLGHLDPLDPDNDSLETRSSNDTSNSVDTLLVNLQANLPQDFPQSNEFQKPQDEAMVNNSNFNIEPTFREDLADQSLEHMSENSEKDLDLDFALKKSQHFEISESSDSEYTENEEIDDVNDTDSANDLELSTSNSSPEEFKNVDEGLDDNERSDVHFTSDTTSLVSEVLKAFDDIQRKGRELLECETEHLCSVTPEEVDNAISNGHKSKDITNDEQLSSHELMEIHEDLVIEPPMSFSDFTIVL